MRLHVLYDSSCGLCSHLIQWMSKQPAACELRFVAAGSDEAKRLFPDFRSEARPEQLVVISDDGGVYRGNDAYIMCLWALNAYRSVAARLAQPALRPLAEKMFAALSQNRIAISQILGMRAPFEGPVW